MFIDKKKKHDEELAEEYGQKNDQIQILMKLEKTSVPSLEGHVDESSQIKAKIGKLTYKNDTEAYLTTFECLMEANKIDMSCWFFHIATQRSGRVQQAYAALPVQRCVSMHMAN